MNSRAGSPGLDVRLVPAAAFGWAVAWLATGLPAWCPAAGPLPASGWLVLLTVASAAAATVAGVRVRRRRRGAALLLVLSVVVGVLGAVAAAQVLRSAGPVPGWADRRAVVVLTGRVSDDPTVLPPGPFGGPPRHSYHVVGATVQARGQLARAHRPILVLGSGAAGPISAGVRVRISGRLLTARPQSGEVAVLSVLGRAQVGPAARPWRVAQRLREALRAASGVPSQHAPTDAAALLPALVVGDVSAIPVDLRAAMQTAGLTHLTAVSGANLTIVAGAVVWLCTAFGARRQVRVLAAAGAIAGFVLLARPQPSVLRAAVMAGVALLGLLHGRPGRGVPALAGCVIVLLVIDPWLARSYGFALSVVATAGLVVLAPALVRRWTRPWQGTPREGRARVVATAVAVPVAAVLCTAPIVAALSPALSLVAVPANLLAGPAVAPATVLGLLAALVGPVLPRPARQLARPALVATAWIATVARFAAAVPHAGVPLTDLPLTDLPLTGRLPAPLTSALVCGVVTVLLMGPRQMWTAAQGITARAVTTRVVTARVLAAGAVTVLAGWLVAGRLAGAGQVWPAPNWLLVQCDVGQGDALVLRSGPDRAVLVDVGPDPALVDGCLNRLGVRELDLLVITHHHDDHAGGLSGALNGRRVHQALVSPLAEPAAQAAEVADRLRAAGVPAGPGFSGARGGSGPLTWQVLWPVRSALTGGPEPVASGADVALEDSAVNDASVVLLVRTGGYSVLALGDLEPAAQRRLAALVPLPRVDLVKVSHHGSARQDPQLYRRLRPRAALIGVGANSYGHPAASTLRMLGAFGATVLRTDRMGDIAVVPAGVGLAARTTRWVASRNDDPVRVPAPPGRADRAGAGGLGPAQRRGRAGRGAAAVPATDRVPVRVRRAGG